MTKFVVLILCFSIPAFAATYKGKNIDGHKFDAVVKNSGDGAIRDARVIFDGRSIYVYTEKAVVTLKMDNEDVDDPLDIEATDGKNRWIISIENLD